MTQPISTLPIGAIFLHAADHFIVVGEDNIQRVCLRTWDNKLVTFDESINVLQTGVSRRAEYYKNNPVNKLK